MSLNPSAETLQAIKAWLVKLATLTTLPPEMKLRDVADRIEAYATHLGAKLPRGAFTSESLAFAVAGEKWFPSAEGIYERAADWWREHKPASAPSLDALPENLPSGWVEMDGHWRDFWFRRLPEIGALTDRHQADFQRARLESLIRSQSPRAWSVISGEKWVHPEAPTAEQIERVAAIIGTREPDQPRKGGPFRDVSLAGDALAAAWRAADQMRPDVHA
jgi:hypothetical protein